METEKRTHLSAGSLVALAQYSAGSDENSESREHTNTCTLCQKEYDKIVTLLTVPRNTVRGHAVNPGSHREHQALGEDLAKDASILITFLEQDPPSDIATHLFQHLNRCYGCFESFARNFSDYLSVTSKFENGSKL